MRLLLTLVAFLSVTAIAQPSQPPDPPAHPALPVAKRFFQALLQADARTAVQLSASPFHLEALRIDVEDQLIQELIKHLRSKRTDLLTLYGVEVLSLEEMEKRYGKVPARLASVPLRGATFAVANINGKAAVAILREVSGAWRVVGYTD